MGALNDLKNEALKTLARIALATGQDAPNELQALRLEVCRACPMLDAENMCCRSCGCYVEVKATMMQNYNPKKAGRKEETHCPQGRWGDVEIANRYRKIDGLPLIQPIESAQ